MADISLLRLDNFRGRMLTCPAQDPNQGRQIIFVSGHRTSLERYQGLAAALAEFGQVISPDLPGFGGMTSFFKVGLTPSLDNYADYLYSFIKFRLARDKPFDLVGLSFGFLVITRLLQRHSDLHHRVGAVVSLAGFASGRGLRFKPWPRRLYTGLAKTVACQPGAWLWRLGCLNTVALRLFYNYSHFGRQRLGTGQRRQKRLEFEIGLWHLNDVRTWGFTVGEMLRLKSLGPSLNLPLWHVFSPRDQLLKADSNHTELATLYGRLTCLPTRTASHVPTKITSAKTAKTYLPPELRQAFSQGESPRS